MSESSRLISGVSVGRDDRAGSRLAAAGRLVVRNVDTRPADALQALLERVGLRVYRHLMVDFLPHCHVLCVCRKAGR